MQWRSSVAPIYATRGKSENGEEDEEEMEKKGEWSLVDMAEGDGEEEEDERGGGWGFGVLEREKRGRESDRWGERIVRGFYRVL